MDPNELTDPREARRIVRLSAAGAVIDESGLTSPFLQIKALAMVLQDALNRLERLERRLNAS